MPILARLLLSFHGTDAKLFTRSPLFANIPKNINIISPSLGSSPAQLSTEHSQFGESKFPDLAWRLDSSDTGEVKEWFLIVEDPDAPLSFVPNHGMHYAIPAAKTTVSAEDFILNSTKSSNKSDAPTAKYLVGGFLAGKNLRGSVYSGPRPPVAHGEHRYFFQIVALREKLRLKKMQAVATRADVLRDMEGKVCGWGEWIGVYENKW